MMLKLSSNLQEEAPELIMPENTHTKNNTYYREEDDYSVGWGYLLEGGCCCVFSKKNLKISQSSIALEDVNSTVYH